MPGLYLPSRLDFDPVSDDFLVEELAKERKYQHFDLPLSGADAELAYDFSKEDLPHRFLPLLGYFDEIRRLKRKDDGTSEEVIKRRPIRFASHSDAAYLQAYATRLTGPYEAALERESLSCSVLAYRSGSGTNIHHAKSLFEEVSELRDCTVVALDISGFFDNLNHEHLKYELSRLLENERLDGHDWTVFRNITRYSWVETEDIDRVLGRKRTRHGRVCTRAEFESRIRGRKNGLVRTHSSDHGIPQGTPISGLYANLYLRSFDLEMTNRLSRDGGSYRRYSDDIAIVLPGEHDPNEIETWVSELLLENQLSLSQAKTESALFHGGRLASDKAIQYLGFTYDGEEILIRKSSLDNYLRKMRRAIRAKLIAAKRKDIPSSEVYKRKLISRFTHKGEGRNFISYAYKASDVLQSEAIRRQVKDHVHWFNAAWDRGVEKTYGGLVY